MERLSPRKAVDEESWILVASHRKIYRNALTATLRVWPTNWRGPVLRTEDTLGAIRFQWWRDALSEMRSAAGPPGRNDVLSRPDEEVALPAAEDRRGYRNCRR